MFTLHQSNHMEHLFAQLAALIDAPMAEILAPEIVVVQSQGMARWLSLELARSQGVCANLDFPFPAAFIWRLFEHSFATHGPSPYEPEVMRWSLMELLTSERQKPGFGQVTAYLQGVGPELRRYHLAGRIAHLFDQYLGFRPDWIKAWSAGEGDHWQATLWRKLMARHGSWHRVAMFDQFAELIKAGAELPCPLPERISIFGIPSLPPSQLECFALLAERIDVHLFLLTPSRHYWSDLANRKEMSRAEISQQGLDLYADLHLEEGCPLLMGLGGLGKEFQALLQNFDFQTGLEAFVEASPATVLGLVQHDLNAATRQPVLARVQSDLLIANDHSILVHVAHSPMREVEILHDQLLDLLANHADLEADDILVMMPEIDRYAPFIEAVFADPSDEGRRLPFAIADRTVPGPLLRAFSSLLDLLSSRLALSQVVSFLEQEPVMSGFGISGEDIVQIRAWLREAGVTWGLSAKHRGRFGVPPESIGTWRAGIDRLFLGFLTPGDGRRLVNGLLPGDVLESGQAGTLTSFANFFESLCALVEHAQQPRSMVEWREILISASATFFGTDEVYHQERQHLFATLDGLARSSALAGNEEALPLEVAVVAIKQGLAAPAGNFLSCGRITMCQLAPMRSIPFAVICLLGMNDSVFPRQERQLGFDLMTKSRRPGDRNRRDDDRYLFLETILSARRALYISYVGMNSSNGPVPPSVVVSELLDHLASRLGLSPQQCEARFVTRHPLQPFSRRYFTGELFSYSVQDQALAATLGSVTLWPGLFARGNALPVAPRTEVALDDLIRFFEHPVRAMLQNRLGLYLDERDDQAADRERFSLDGLDNYALTWALLREALADNQQGLDLCTVGQIRGELALGDTGRCQYEPLRQQAVALADRLIALRGKGPLPPQEVRIAIDGTMLIGELNDLWENGQVLCRPGKVKKVSYVDVIRSWIKHLALCASSQRDWGQTIFLYRDGLRRYPYVANAGETLQGLLELYQLGQGWPLPLFPKTSLAYAGKMWSGRGERGDQAMTAAAMSWNEGDYVSGPERCDPYLSAVYGDRDPLVETGEYSFAEVACLVLAPALQTAREESF